jgi:outer membrane lipoprotein LolB
VTLAGRRAALAALLAVMTVMAGCATRPPLGNDWLSGRLSVKVDAVAERPARSISSGFELRGDGEQGELRLTSPLGTVVATAHWAPGVARLVTADGETRYPDLETLAREALGEALPLRALPAWLHGQPWPGAPSLNTAAGFEQLGWQIGLARYAEGWLEVTRGSAPAVTVRARLEKPA